MHPLIISELQLRREDKTVDHFAKSPSNEQGL